MSLLNCFKFQTHMDLVGQRRAENVARIIITLLGLIGFFWGYVEQQFSYTVYALGCGFALAILLTLPPWHVYRKNPIQWQKVRETGEPRRKK